MAFQVRSAASLSNGSLAAHVVWLHRNCYTRAAGSKLRMAALCMPTALSWDKRVLVSVRVRSSVFVVNKRYMLTLLVMFYLTQRLLLLKSGSDVV